ncbi:hypothetical protein GCM10009539_81090 [Cryptosporangium japonicum]|uniref:PH domain-containing protein n=1 Tax=Cryptosporangium japonicum TaxID=80872 RepID=A0ABN0V8L2_9ACTN
MLGSGVNAGLRSLPYDWPPTDSFALQLTLAVGTPGLVLVLTTLVYVAVLWRSCRPPKRGFALGRYGGQPAFAAPMSPLYVGGTCVTQLCVVGLYAPIPRPGSNDWSDPSLRVMIVLVAVMAGLLLVLSIAMLFRPPHLRITANGLVVSTLGSRVIPWDALAYGGPTGNEVRRGALWLQARGGTLGLGGPHVRDLHGRLPLPGFYWFRLKLGATLVDPVFLADALRTYRDDVPRRSAIGTAEELASLLAPARDALAGRP